MQPIIIIIAYALLLAPSPYYIYMHTDSHSFEELDVTELLDGRTDAQSQPHRAMQFIKNNEDLFNSHFCDEDYYVPVKKRSMSF